MRKESPLLLLCGHCHVDPGFAIENTSRVVNAGFLGDYTDSRNLIPSFSEIDADVSRTESHVKFYSIINDEVVDFIDQFSSLTYTC